MISWKLNICFPNAVKNLYINSQNCQLPKHFLSLQCVPRSSIHSHDTRSANKMDTIYTRTQMAAKCIRSQLPSLLNDTPHIILNKIDTHFTVVKRTRVPAGSLVKMATDEDVDSGRKKTLIQYIEAYTWNVLSGKIHGGIRNIQCKSRLRGTFHRCTTTPRKIFFDEGASCLCFVGVEGTCIFSRRYLAYLRGYLRCTRVPALFLIFITACFTELWWRKRGHKLVNANFVMKNYISCQSNCVVSIWYCVK